MRRDPSEIDRLIEQGLSFYGTGKIDSALHAWERALELDPDNPQANSYVDYVRVNYDLLQAAQLDVNEDGAPFGIEEEPEYEIEITAGELATGEPAPITIDPHDNGWNLADDARLPGQETADLELELEAEEPPRPEEPPHPEGISFDDATTEYQGQGQAKGRGKPPAGSDFLSEESTGGFSQSTTDIKQRQLGFVTPSALPPELPKVTLRTPGGSKAKPPNDEQPAVSKAPTLEIAPSREDLIASLPSPRPAGTGARLEKPTRSDKATVPAPVAATPAAYADTAPGFKATPVGPIPLDLEDPPAVSSAPTQDDVSVATATTKEFAGVPTAKLPSPPEIQELEPPVVTQPTRDLGIRPKRATESTGLDEEDQEPTKQADVRAYRAANAARVALGTQQDIVLPFDPIDARSAKILDEVDATAPQAETKEDRTRRRITDLIERAQAWNGITEIDKAVTALELALSEDPNSALAQKLIHRNRDTIMTIFQSFLGDLDRQPALARPLHELASAPISPRAAFLLSRIDGTLTLDEILDVSGMPRIEAYRHLCQLFLRGILR